LRIPPPIFLRTAEWDFAARPASRRSRLARILTAPVQKD
jgi:hypothetical protein